MPGTDPERFGGGRRTPLIEPSARRTSQSNGMQFKDLLLGLLLLSLASGAAWYLVNVRNEGSLPPGFGPDAAVGRLSMSHDSPSRLDVMPPAALATDSVLASVDQPSALDGSDAQVAQALMDLSPRLLRWLTPDEQIRKWVLLVTNMADGSVSAKHHPVRYPMARFATQRVGGQLIMSPLNFERTVPLLDATLSIPPEKLAAYYRQWTPVLERSFAELGRDGTFHGHFVAVLDNIIAVEGEGVSAGLKQPHVLYEYNEPGLEDATDLNKLLWRLGPQRMALVQRYAAELKAAL